jgi:putative transposase
MNLIRSISVKLDVHNGDILLDTIKTYTKAYNTVCKIGWDAKEFNGVRLHFLSYPLIRESLPSQLAISARMKATESLKSTKARLKQNKKTSCPKSKMSSIRLDANSYNVWFDKNEASILTTKGRQRFKFQSYEYLEQFLTWKRKSADLIYNKGKILLTFIFEKTVPDENPKSDTFVGIDRGIRRLAVTSNKIFFGGGRVKAVSNRYQRRRSSLQSCGTPSAKRHLMRSAQKENRFRRDVNHCISKKIVQSLPGGSTIVLEDLKYIRERCKHRKDQKGEFHSWSFFQLEMFLTYKAAAIGVSIVYVDPRYTSKKCSKCGHISRSNRKNQTQFKCTKCGYILNADLNASFNIKNNYLDSIRHPSRAPVNEPIVSNKAGAKAQALYPSDTSHGPCARGS